jgi:hypothetical protein
MCGKCYDTSNVGPEPAASKSTSSADTEPDLNAQRLISKAMSDRFVRGYKIEWDNGWQDRRVPAAFNPKGLVLHHNDHDDDGVADITEGALDVLRYGNGVTPGPLAQFGLGRKGTIWVLAAGRANHAGYGEWLDLPLHDNGAVWGIEAQNDGEEAWPPVQIRAYICLAAALARATGFTHEYICSHKEWRKDWIDLSDPERQPKPDPHSIDMDWFREQVRNLLLNPPAPVTAFTIDPTQWSGAHTFWQVGPTQETDISQLLYAAGRGAGAFCYRLTVPDVPPDVVDAEVAAVLTSSEVDQESDVTLLVNGRDQGTHRVPPYSLDGGPYTYWRIAAADLLPGQENLIEFRVRDDAELKNGLHVYARSLFPVQDTPIKVTVPPDWDAPAPETNDSVFIVQTVPPVMTPGSRHAVSIRMRNIGAKTWIAGRHFLGSVSPTDNTLWGLNRVALTENVPPGGEAVFDFEVVAPRTLGEHTFRWKMVEETVTWFGPGSPLVAVSVVPARADIVAVEPSPTGGVNYMVGISHGNGQFAWGATNLQAMTPPLFFGVADVSGDKRADIVAVEPLPASAGSGVRYMLGVNQGNGQFSWMPTNLTGMAKPLFVGLADVDGDGRDDIVAVEPNPAGGVNYMVGFSRGNGQFTWAASNLVGMATPLFVCLADLDGNGRADLVAVEPLAAADGGGVRYMVGWSQGNGQFGWSGTNLARMATPVKVVVGDVTGDGRADIIAAEPEPMGGVRYMVGISQGNGQFGWVATNLARMSTPSAVSLADVTGDGCADLVVAEPNPAGGGVRYMLGASQRNGTFAWAYTNVSSMAAPLRLALGDTAIAPVPVTTDCLAKGQTITRGTDLVAGNGLYKLSLQTDGNLVLYGLYPTRVLWATNNRATVSLTLQDDGNLVAYDAKNKATWSTGTRGSKATLLRVQSDGNLVLYTADDRAVWATGTRGR